MWLFDWWRRWRARKEWYASYVRRSMEPISSNGFWDAWLKQKRELSDLALQSEQSQIDLECSSLRRAVRDGIKDALGTPKDLIYRVPH